MSRRARLISLLLIIAWFGSVRTSDGYVLIVYDFLLELQFIAQNQQVQNIWTQVDTARRLWLQLSSALSAGRTAVYSVLETPWRQFRGDDDDPLQAYTPLKLALINGDAGGAGYRQVAPVPPADIAPPDTSETTRERIAMLDRAVRTIDGYSQLAVHQISINLTAGKTANRVLALIDGDRRGRTSGSVALLQDVVGTRAVAVQDGHMRNITLAQLLESELAEQLLLRDSDAVNLQADVERRTTFLEVAQQSRAGTTELLTNWRLP